MNRHTIGIVGGSGFIGASLAEHLSTDFRVKVFDQKPLPENLRKKVDFQHCDVRDYHDLRKKIEDLDLVILTAIVQVPLINEDKRLGYEVNVLGAQNVCEVVNQSKSIKGLILSGTWQVLIKSEVEERSKFYTLTKLAQETLLRIYSEMSDKTYAILRLGTVLGERMPEKTAANIFITKGLKGEEITPYKHSMHRPMFYGDINDICRVSESLAKKILNDEVKKIGDSSAHIFNLAYPIPVTILDLATIVRDAITKQSQGEIRPEIRIVDKRLPNLYEANRGEPINVDMRKVKRFLGVKKITSPREAIERIVAQRFRQRQSGGFVS